MEGIDKNAFLRGKQGEILHSYDSIYSIPE